MKFRTELNTYPSEVKICYTDSIFMIGSCFTTTIGKNLQKSKFSTMVNPYGTLYHPFIIRENIGSAISGKPPSRSFLSTIDNRRVHFKYHSDLHAADDDSLLELIQVKNNQVRAFLKRSKFVFITLGSSFYFYHNIFSQIVGNCHKQPANLFRRKLATAKEIANSLNQLISVLLSHNSKCDIIFTVSPVRHVRDGLIQNSRSKAHLLSAVHEVSDQNDNVSYFPAYEMIMDDLRDYRFYEKDLVHPNSQAISYIWSKFSDQYFSLSTSQIVNRIEKVHTACAHRPFDQSSSSYQEFLVNIKNEMCQLEDELSLDFNKEKAEIDRRLITRNVP